MVNPEKIPDVDEGSKTGPAPIDGLTAEEQAQVDAMNAGNAPPGADGEPAEPAGDADASADGESDEGDDEPEVVPDAAVADGTAKTDAEPRQVPKTVSYGKHQRELAKANKARDDLQARLDGALQETAKEREARTRLDERSKLLLEAINTKAAPAAPAPKEPDDPEPNADEDPIGHTQWETRQLKRELAEIKGGQQRQQAATQAETEETQILDTLESDIRREASADPTMMDAFSHLRDTRYTELGYIFANIDINDPKQCATLTASDAKALEQHIINTFRNEQVLVARQSIAAGRSPASVVRNLARSRGWVPKAAEAPAAAADADPAKSGNGAPKAAGTGPAVRSEAPRGSVKDQLSAVRDNLEASRSLSDAGGSPGGAMTPERLASMSEREFQEYFNSIPKDQMDSLMGKPDNM